MPDGQTTRLRQINPTGKFTLNSSGKSDVYFRASHPIEGRIAIVTNVRWDAVDADVTETSVT
jgi:hypothetical protein